MKSNHGLKVLVVGAGGREHALAWKLNQNLNSSDQARSELFVWPGNALTQSSFSRLDIHGGASKEQFVEACVKQSIDLVVIGPEKYLAEGYADLLRLQGIAAFGAGRDAAQLESSKAFAKEVMAAASIPTAGHCTVDFDSLETAALEFLETKGSVVIKASGLASGKGVFVCHDQRQVEDGVKLLAGSSMRAAADEVVLEECLVGRECSYFTFIGKGVSTPIGFAVDFKRLKEGDEGPNTGGMGCYTPVPWLPESAGADIEEQVVKPLLKELAKRGIDYNGCLYVGVMWTDAGPKVVEFNVRLGDPEAQVLAVSDQRNWLDLIAFKTGLKHELPRDFNTSANFKPSVCKVAASASYPYGQGKNQEAHPVLPDGFFEMERDADCSRIAFGAAVEGEGASIKVGSGRVLAMVSSGNTFANAKRFVTAKIEQLLPLWPGMQYRKDIAEKLIEEQK